MKWRFRQEWLLVAFATVYIWPLLHHLSPLYWMYPDIQYVKAKVLWVAAGDLYGDPVTGQPTFHPPYYHLLLNMMTGLGIGIRRLLWGVSLVNVSLMIFFVFKIVREAFGRDCAFWAVLLLPFLLNYMGPNNPFLPSTFYFSLPFYLAGLWLYVRPKSSRLSLWAAIGALWGTAFLISPVYLFLIGFTFIHEIFFIRDRRRSAIFAGTFLIVIIPFFVQAAVVWKAGMTSTESFSFWPGLPDFEWLQKFFAHLISPSDPGNIGWQAGVTSILMISGIYAISKSCPAHPFVYIAALAYLFTAFHFRAQYSGRILIFLTLFMTGHLIAYIRNRRTLRIAATALGLLLAGYGMADHLVTNEGRYAVQEKDEVNYSVLCDGLRSILYDVTEPGSTILASDKIYLHYIMPEFRIHGLVAYRTGEYFQVGHELSESIQHDYELLMRASNPATIEWLCNKYQITVAVVSEFRDRDKIGFRTIAGYWRLVHRNKFFRIYQRPAEGEEITPPRRTKQSRKPKTK